jgi:hypothetical protein
MNKPYISGHHPPPELPLGRFIPPVPEGVVQAWCRDNLSPGSWILDPFGFNPLIPLELAAAGYPVVVTANNPIHAFMLRTLAGAPAERDFLAALQDLAVESKGDDRMEPYIRSLYEIACADCGQRIEADAFLWRKEDSEPFAALVTCPYCGARGEQEMSKRTRETMSVLPGSGLHRARALVRIADQNDPLRSQVENALNCYPTRALIILQTIINKLENLEQTPRRRELLTALILHAADQGNTLWAYPSPRDRPRQLVVPPVYQEKNLWKALEEAIILWTFLENAIPVVRWEERGENDRGILLFEGRLKELSPELESFPLSAVVTAVPRPNQAFWTLSALWSGWLWGQEAVHPIRQVLARQRYDWNWHTNALRAVMEMIHRTALPSNLTFFGLVAENEPMLLLSALLAADSSAFQLTGFAQSLDDNLAQCRWSALPSPPARLRPQENLAEARKTAEKYLQKKGEPASYQQIQAAVITHLASRNALVLNTFKENENQFTSETQRHLDMVFQSPDLLMRIGGGTASLDTGIWWLQNPPATFTPLIDRVEKIIVRHLIDQSPTSSLEVSHAVHTALPGIFTPSNPSILNCLDSYGDLSDQEAHIWTLKEADNPFRRKEDIAEIRQLIIQMAHKLSYAVDETDTLTWHEPHSDHAPFCFHILASAIVNPHLLNLEESPKKHILLLPGSRANLLAFKKQRDPALKERLDRGFVVIKFRLIRDLSVNPLLSRELFMEQISTDPPEYQDSQLALF